MPTGRKIWKAEGAAEAASWFFDNSFDMFAVTREGRIVSVSPSWNQATGWTDAETLGRNALEMVHPESVASVRAAFASLAEGGPAVTCEMRLLTKTGAEFWAETRAKRAVDGSTLLVLQDMTDRRQRTAMVEVARSVGELLQTNVGVFVWRYNPDLHEYEMNPDFAGDFATAPADRRRPGDEVQGEIHPDDQQTMNNAWRHTVDTGALAKVEYRNLHEGEHWRRLRSAWCGSHRLPSGRWEVIGVSQDLTELMVERDRAQAAAKAKTQFLANMSHELQTPLNGVLGLLHLIRGAGREQDRHQMVDDALTAGAGLSQILSDVVTFAEVESDDFEIQRQPADPLKLAQGVVQVLRDGAEARGLSLVVRCDEPLGWMSIDSARLRQLLMNLVGNALKFTIEGAVEVRLTARGEGGHRRLRVEIADTGVGIPKAVQANLFEQFSQADGSTTRRFGGVGLGLAISRRLVKRLGGRLDFESREGEGTTFWFDIPAAARMSPLEDLEPEGAAPPSAEDGYLAGLKVLVVEDNATNRLVATRMLGELGAEVCVAEDGRQGVAALEHDSFDLVFMDIQMPVMDGVEATRCIRALPGGAAQTPIIALTANVQPQQISGYLAAGMNGCIAKPISPSALIMELSRLAQAGVEASAA